MAISQTQRSEFLAAGSMVLGAGFVGYEVHRCLQRADAKTAKLNDLLVRAAEAANTAKAPTDPLVVPEQHPLTNRVERVAAVTTGAIGGAGLGLLTQAALAALVRKVIG